MTDDFAELRGPDGSVNLDTIREEITLHHGERWWESVCRTLFDAYDALNREIEQATAEARKYLSCPDPTLYDLRDAIAQLAQVKITALDNCKTLEQQLAMVQKRADELEKIHSGKYTMRAILDTEGNVATSIEPNEVALLKQGAEKQAATIARLRAVLQKVITRFESISCHSVETAEVVGVKEANQAIRLESHIAWKEAAAALEGE